MIEVITKVHLEKVKGWLAQGRAAVALADMEETEGFVPFPRSNVQRLVNSFNLLHLRPEWRLDAYVWRSTTMGGGLLMPRGRDFPVLTPEELPNPTVPPGAKPWLSRRAHHAVAMVAGDGSAESYLQASLLSRELEEIGAFFETQRWHEHQLVDRVPELPEPSDFDPVDAVRVVRFPHPLDLTPRVRQSVRGVEVIFYTAHLNEPGQLFRFNDRYVRGRGYCFISSQTLVVDVKKSRRALTEGEEQVRPPGNETEVVQVGAQG